MPSLQTHELSQPSPLKRISSRDSDERLFKGREANHPSKWQEGITPEKIEVDDESMTR
jgi:hypothetical protein